MPSLGCKDYRTLILPRATLSRTVLEVPWSSVKWGRVLDDTSSGSVTAGGGCCTDVLRDSIRPWSHTLAIIRVGDGRVWSGPLVGIRDTDEGIAFDARDLSAWLDHRRVHDLHAHTLEELTSIYESLWDDAMAPDPIEDYTLSVTPGTVTGDREVLPEQNRIAGDELRELGRTGVDWTVVDRVHYVAADEIEADLLGLFIGEHFLSPPEVEIDGTVQANDWVVAGAGGGAEGDEVVGVASSTPGPEGLLESVASESGILDVTSADAAAATRLARSEVAPVFVRQGTLAATAPVGIGQLIPGARARLSLSGRCLRVDATQRLLGVQVDVNRAGGAVTEQVTLSFEPLGTVADT
jgi:hypothetical protein